MYDELYKNLIYRNLLSSHEDVKYFIMEGQGKVSFPDGRMRMESLIDGKEGQKANIVFWCRQDFPENLKITWEFYPIREPGLCILFFDAQAIDGGDIFSKKLSPRTGEYNQYHHGDINAYHISYFRRKHVSERAFHTCNLRKSYGFHMVAQGADPLPSVIDAICPYKIKLIKHYGEIFFYINNLMVFQWKDDGVTYGEILNGGKIGFRQMAPLVAEYSNLEIYGL